MKGILFHERHGFNWAGTVVAAAFAATAGGAFGAVVINESFAGTSVPEGWIMNGRENAPNWDNNPAAGTAKLASDWFLSDATGRFLRLTENSADQRTTAVYGTSAFRTDRDFTLRMDLRISDNTNSADGITIFWLDAGSISNLATTIGGSGEWEGTPRGAVTGTSGSENNTSSYGWYTGLRGYALEFDHYRNDESEFPEYTALLNLSDWSHVNGTATDFSSNTGFFEGNGWQTVQLSHDAEAGRYTLSWGWDGSAFANSTSYSPTGVGTFPAAYFGIGAGSGGWASDQDVRNIRLDAVHAVPEPSVGVGLAFVVLGGLLSGDRRRPRSWR